MKRAFTRLVKVLLPDIVIDYPIIILYKLYVWTKRKIDINNVICIEDKFFSDSLVEAWILKDDSSDQIKWTINLSGWYEKDNERLEVYILPYDQWLFENLLNTYIQSSKKILP